MPIFLIDKIKPKNNGMFPLVDASNVDMGDGKRLSEMEFGGGASSWNDLADRPFYEDTVTYLEWDGDTTGLETLSVSEEEDFSVILCKISDEPITLEQAIGSTELYIQGNEITETEITEDLIDTSQDGLLVVNQSALSVLNDSFETGEMTLTKGVWVYYVIADGVTAYTQKLSKGEIKILDAKFIPDEYTTEDEVKTLIDNAIAAITNGNEVAY